MKKLLVISLAYLIVLVGIVSADTLQVPSDYATLDAALAASAEGDTVMQTQAGYFRPADAGQLTIPRYRVLTIDYSAGLTPKDCIIQTGSRASPRVLYMEEGATLDGFQVLVTVEIAIRASSHTVIQNVIVVGTEASEKGLWFDHCDDVLVENVTIDGRGWLLSGMRFLYSSCTVRNSIVIGCTIESIAAFSTQGDWQFNLTDFSEFQFSQSSDINLAHNLFNANPNLNTCSVPVPISDAIGNASDGGDIGALSYPIDPETTNFRLEMADVNLIPGDTFDLKLAWDEPAMCNGLSADAIVILEAYGIYYFWPTWTEDYAFQTLTIPDLAAGWQLPIFEPFTWPEAGHGNAAFWSAMFACGFPPAVDTLLTPIDHQAFNW